MLSSCRGVGDGRQARQQYFYPARACAAARANFFLNHTLAAISHRETMVEGSLFSLHTHALAVEAIGALCTRQFSRQVCYSINAHHLGLEATPILNNPSGTGSHTHSEIN